MYLRLLTVVGCMLLCVGTAAPLFAQTAAHLISGTVYDPQGFAVRGAAVRLLGANRVLLVETATSDDGSFELAGVAAGRYELRVEAAGFSPYQRVVDVPRETAEPLSIRLRLTPVELQVTVTGRHGAPEETLVEPATVRIRGAGELARRDPAHLPRMFAEEPGVLIQETTPGQGSPILRGQGAQTVLYLVDGIRYNNSTYRSGNTQYLGWVPASATDSVEVFLGPASAQYGSDALGGAIHVMSTPLLPWADRGLRWSAETNTFFSSADLAGGSSLRAAVAAPRASFTLTGSFRRHQGLRAGGGEDSHHVLRRFFELSPAQVRSILGSRMIDTDYAQSSWSSKLGFRLDDLQFLTFAWMQSEQFGIRRYDRLLGGEGRLLHNFGPQRLGFGYARYQRLGTGALRSVSATFSINRQTDGQTTQTRATSPRENDINRVTALGYLVSTAWAPLARHSLTAGGEFYDEFVFGRAFARAPDGPPVPIRPRFPNGTRYQSLGLYLSDDWHAIPDKLLIEAGMRFSSFRFRSFAAKNVFVDGRPTVPDATETFTDVTFHAGFSYFLRPELVLFGRTARGFRAPTVFDLGEQGITGGGFEVSPAEAVRLGAEVGDSAGSGAVSTGNRWQPLAPEVLWSFEGGLRWRLERVSGDLTVFDSEFFDAIQRRVVIVPAAVVGQTIGGEAIITQDAAGRIFVAADPRPVVSRANIGRVRIWGVEASTRVDWARQWNSSFRFAAHRGRELDTGNFARRIAPDFFFASLRWTDARGRVWLEAFTEVSGPQTRLNPAELDDPRIGALRTAGRISDFFNNGARRLGLVSGGVLTLTGETLNEIILRVLGPAAEPAPLFTRTDGFATLNFRGGFVLGERSEVVFALLNLTDTNYRRHGSGVDAPGINFTLSYRFRFLR
jgi:outer membrane receptor protein involved in Fe transport